MKKHAGILFITLFSLFPIGLLFSSDDKSEPGINDIGTPDEMATQAAPTGVGINLIIV